MHNDELITSTSLRVRRTSATCNRFSSPAFRKCPCFGPSYFSLKSLYIEAPPLLADVLEGCVL